MDPHDNRRRRSNAFSYILLFVIVLLFMVIMGSLIYGKLSDIEETAIITWGGTLVGAIGTAISYEWGSSKGSTIKDEMAAAAGSAGGTKTTVSAPDGGPATATVETKP